MKIPVQASRPFRVRSFNPALRTRKTAFVVFLVVMGQNFDLCQSELFRVLKNQLARFGSVIL